jgi:peptide/nickel transport system substrate-binding protein
MLSRIGIKQFIQLSLIIVLVTVAINNVLLVNSQTPKYGGTLVIGVSTDLESLNPAFGLGATPSRVLGKIFDPMILYDEELQPQPSLIESWEISSDGLTYTWNLRENVKWHDGEPFTSADVKFSIDEILLKYNALSQTTLNNYDYCETTDENTVLIHLSSPWAPLMTYLHINFFSVCPKHLYEGTDIMTNPTNMQPVGTGPFKFDEYVTGSHLTLVKNEDYWGEGPYLDKIIFKIMPSFDALVAALEAKEVHYVPNVFPPHEVERVNAISGLKVDTVINPVSYTYKIGFNLDREFTQNLQVRKAIAHALDREAILQTVTQGYALPANGPIIQNPYTNWIFSGKDPRPFPYEYNVDKANQLLDEAGYPKGADGKRLDEPLTFIFHTRAPDNEKIANLAKSFLAEVGIDIKLEKYEFASWKTVNFIDRAFDLGISTIANGVPDLAESRNHYHSSTTGTGPWTNFCGYKNSRVDWIIDNQPTTVDINERSALAYEMQEIMQEDLPAVWLYAKEDINGWNEEFINLPVLPYGSEPANDVWWTGGEEAAEPFPWTEVAIVAVIIAVAVIALVYWRIRK